MSEITAYSKRGYLNEEFRIFHLKDCITREYEYHYHEFAKIVIFLSGSVRYIVEGTSYMLQPGDILAINHHLIHKAEIDASQPYERYVIYINKDFADKNSTEITNIFQCFNNAEKERDYLIRPDESQRIKIKMLLKQMQGVGKDDMFGADVIKKTLFLQMLVNINRAALQQKHKKKIPESQHDEKIAGVLEYINENLCQDLSVEILAGKSYLSKYYFMRRFKEMTGYTVHSYVLQKRTLNASELIRSGMPATKAAVESGFGDYSAFFRAFKKLYKTLPREFKQ